VLTNGDTLAALTAFDELIAYDSTSADAWYESARLYDELGRYQQAARRYRRAKDLDPLRFRAPEEMNAIIRETSAKCGASVVEIEDAFAAVSPIGIPGNELILEHLHPNVDGYLLMADQYYSTLRDHQAIPEWPNTRPVEMTREDVLVTELDSTLASWHVRRLLNNWPFQERGTTRSDTLRIATPTDSLALEILRGRTDWTAATAALGALHERRGELQPALRAALALVDEQSYRATPYILAANLFVRQQRFSAALQYFAAADEREPSIEARRTAGGILARAGRYTEAQPWLERALELDPNDRSALFDLGVTNAALGQTEKARELMEHLLELEPNSEAAKRVLLRLNTSRQ
jgi:tetratricopeptide (TPR) repeat protein